MKRTLFLVTIAMAIISQATVAQDLTETDIELLNQNQGWHEGTITLIDSKVLTGLVRYNARDDFFSYNDGDNVRVFTAKSMMQAVYVDSKTNLKHTYYSLPYRESPTDQTEYLIFEVLKEYRHFAILIRLQPASIGVKKYQSTINNPSMPGGVQTIPVTRYSNKVEVSQVETIYILDEDGSVKVYLEMTHNEDGTKSLLNGKDRKTKRKDFDKEVLAEHVGPTAFAKLEDFAQIKKLSFKKKEDLILILNHYDSIRDEI